MRLPSLPLVLAAAGHLLAGTALAQDRPERPYRGLFASGAGDAAQVLTVDGAIGVGYDTSVQAEVDDLVDVIRPSETQGSGYALLSAGLSYSLNTRRVGLSATVFSGARYYPSIGGSLTSSGAGIGASWSPSNRTQIRASQTITHQPFSLYPLFPDLQQPGLGQVFVPDLDYSSLNTRQYTFTTGAGITRQLSRRASISADYSRYRSDFNSLSSSFGSDTASVRFTRSLSDGFGLRLGYGYFRAQYDAEGRTFGRHVLDTGVDYSRTLSFSRRTTLTFSTGGTAVTDAGSTHVNAVGTANLDHEIGRTWNYYVAYNRNVDFVETFRAPYVYDSINTGLTGLLSRRVSFHASAGAALGNLGFDSTSGGALDTVYATAGIGRAITRHLSVGLDYSYFTYSFDRSALLPSGFTRDLGRHSIRASLSAWSPLFQRGRRSDAAR